jgi:hypothetical protein
MRSELVWEITQRIVINTLRTFWGQPIGPIFKGQYLEP